MGNKLIGYGSYLPERVMTNADFEKVMDTSDEWIVSHTGVKERHWARDDETVVDIGFEAAQRALKNAGISVDDLDMIIVASCTAEEDFPSVAAQISGRLNAKVNIPAFDMNAACTGMIYAMHIARAFFNTGMHKRIMLIGAEKMSRLIDMKDRNTAILFGDGAGALIFEPSTEDFSGIIDTDIMADGKLASLVYSENGKVIMNGPDLYKRAVQYMPDAAEQVLQHAGVSADDVDWIIPHQANIRIIQSVAKRLNFPIEKIVATVDRHANTSAASGVLALADALDKGVVKHGDLILYPAFGSGLTWGCALFKV